MSLSYQNPVWDGYCADPMVLRVGDFYYCYATGSNVGDIRVGDQQSEPRHFVVLRSPNLVDWEPLGGALVPAPGQENAPHWAPEVCERDGQFWMYYSAAKPGDDTTHRLRVAVSDVPQGPFRDCGVALLEDEGFSIDASPFCDPQSGKWYLFFARDYFENRVGTGTAVVELGDDMTSVRGPFRPVVVASHDWQIYERPRTHYGREWDAWHTVEGPFVVFHDSKYWCFFSGGNWRGPDYGVGVAVADHPLGPWQVQGDEPSVLRARNGVIGPGHNSVVLAPDGQTHVCVYHAWNEERTKRQLCIDPIEWREDGPHVVPSRERRTLDFG